MSRWVLRFAVIMQMLFVVSMVRAEPSEADRATARALAAEGYRALQHKEYELAADRFRRADKLVHAPTLVVDHARALVGLGRLVQARGEYELVLREGVKANAPAPWKRALMDAELELEKLKPRLAWLTVTVSGPNSPRVTVDGELVPAEELGTRRAVNPGERTVRVTAPGFQKSVRKVTLTEGDEDRLDLILTSGVSEADVEVAPSVGMSSEPQQIPSALSEESETRRTLTYTALGIGGVGLITGSVFGILALNKRSDLKAACNGNDDCPPNQRTNLETYRTFGTLSGIGFGVGLAGAGSGVALLLTRPTKSNGERAGMHVAPYVGAHTLGAMGQF